MSPAVFPRYGSCAQTEVCIEGTRALPEPSDWAQQYHQDAWLGLYKVAYCVNVENFVRIAQDGLADADGAGEVETVYFHQQSQQPNATVEAVVTSLDNKTSVFAQRLEVEAQTADGAFGTQIWRTLVNGSSGCENCSSVDLAPFPIAAKRIKVDVVLPAAVTAGVVWLASVPYLNS